MCNLRLYTIQIPINMQVKIDKLNLNISVEEKNTGSATIGAGYGDQNGTTLTAGAATLNAVADLTGATGLVAVSEIFEMFQIV